MCKKYIYRDITLNDEKDVLEICKGIWDGDDYIPYVWKKFVEDENYYFKGLEVDGKIVGFSDMIMFNRDSAWFEGLRVSSSERGKGYGKFISTNMMKYSLTKGIKRFYFSTYYQNKESIKLHEKMNFQIIKKYKYLIKENIKNKENLNIKIEKAVYPEKIINNDWVFIIPETLDKERFFPNVRMITDNYNNMILFSDDLKSSKNLSINYFRVKDENNFLKLIKDLEIICSIRNKGRFSIMCENEKEISIMKKSGYSGFTDENFDVFLYFAEVNDLDLNI